VLFEKLKRNALGSILGETANSDLAKQDSEGSHADSLTDLLRGEQSIQMNSVSLHSGPE
jgi:hypothetical protein